MKSSVTQNNFIAYVIFLIGFFVLIFYTKTLYSEYQILSDEKENISWEISRSEKLLGELNLLKDELTASGSSAVEEISPFNGQVSDTLIMEYLFDYASEINADSDRVVYRDIDISYGDLTDLWFYEASVNVSAIFAGESTLFNFLSTMTGEGAEYRFYISDFSYPLGQRSGNIQMSIPMKLYYK